MDIALQMIVVGMHLFDYSMLPWLPQINIIVDVYILVDVVTVSLR